MLELNLLGKTELWIENIELRNVNLGSFAAVVADVLGLDRREVIVTDVRDNHVTLDILRKTVYAEQIYGKQKMLLKRLGELPGVKVSGDTSIHSEGILGFIALDEEEAERVIESSRKMSVEMRSRIARRAIVFSTGSEVAGGVVEDTNKPIVARRLEEEGYRVDFGPTLEDDENYIAAKIWDSIHRGFGLVVLTGGVGAEDKDRTVEGVLKVDGEASTPYIAKFERGTGRHVKDGVRIAVGKVGETRIIALPGPSEEVKVGLDAAIGGVAEGLDKNLLASNIAQALRDRLRAQMAHS